MHSISWIIILLCYQLSNADQLSDCGVCHAYNNGKCFKILENKFVNYYDANDLCLNNDGSHLVSIRSQEEQQFLINILNAYKVTTDVWIGAQITHNGFIWTDNSEVNYTNWENGYPNKDSGYDCVRMRMNEPNSGKWYNELCDKTHAVVCEKDYKYVKETGSEKSKRSLDEIEFENFKSRFENITNYLIAELVQTKTELNKTKDRLESEINNNKEKLENTESHFNQLLNYTNKDLEIMKHELNLAREESENIKERLTLTKKELENTREDLILTNIGVKSIRTAIHLNAENANQSFKTIQTKLSNIDRNPIPVGFIYIQLPRQADPRNLWPSVNWKIISTEYAGHFFRVEGGNASEFGQSQSDAFQAHQHSYHHFENYYGGWSRRQGNYHYLAINAHTLDIVSDGHNGEPRVANETRPINYSVRVWMRSE